MNYIFNRFIVLQSFLVLILVLISTSKFTIIIKRLTYSLIYSNIYSTLYINHDLLSGIVEVVIYILVLYIIYIVQFNYVNRDYKDSNDDIRYVSKAITTTAATKFNKEISNNYTQFRNSIKVKKVKNKSKELPLF